jgi:hypothetical protein
MSFWPWSSGGGVASETLEEKQRKVGRGLINLLLAGFKAVEDARAHLKAVADEDRLATAIAHLVGSSSTSGQPPSPATAIESDTVKVPATKPSISGLDTGDVKSGSATTKEEVVYKAAVSGLESESAAMKEVVYNDGDHVEAQTAEGWFSAQVLRNDMGLCVLFDDKSLHICPATHFNVIRRPTGNVGSCCEYETKATNPAWKAMIRAEMALSKLLPVANDLISMFGPRVAPGQHIWRVHDLKMERQRIVQICSVDAHAVLETIRDPVSTPPISASASSSGPADSHIVSRVTWSWITTVDWVPTFSVLLNDTTIDDLAICRVIHAIANADNNNRALVFV